MLRAYICGSFSSMGWVTSIATHFVLAIGICVISIGVWAIALSYQVSPATQMRTSFTNAKECFRVLRDDMRGLLCIWLLGTHLRFGCGNSFA